MKRKYTLAFISIVIFCFLLYLLYLFLFGSLFPFSPLVFGFQKHELNNIIVYIQNGSTFKDYQVIDTYPGEVESFLDLKFSKKPKIYIFSDRNSYLERAKTKARFIAYPNRSIMISPWAIKDAQDGTISLEIYMKHELSHILLYQNMGFIADLRYPKWLLEGIAMYTSNQLGTSLYPSKSQVYELIQKGNYFPPQFYETSQKDDIQLDVENRVTFMYSEFACIVNFLIERYGREKFHQYMTGLMVNKNHDNLFKKIYNISFTDFQDEFIEHVKNNAFK